MVDFDSIYCISLAKYIELLTATGQIILIPFQSILEMHCHYHHQEWKLRRDLLKSYMQLINQADSVIQELSGRSHLSNLEVGLNLLRDQPKSCPEQEQCMGDLQQEHFDEIIRSVGDERSPRHQLSDRGNIDSKREYLIDTAMQMLGL